MTIRSVVGICLMLAEVKLGSGQTRLDLRAQARNVDFADAVATKPFVVGTALPINCSTGEAFFKSTAPAGENLYICTQTDTWVLSGPAAPYIVQFTTPTDPWVVTGAIHGLGTAVEVFTQEDDGGTNWKRIYAGSVLINKNNGDITVDWSEPRTGRMLISQLKGGRAGEVTSGGVSGPHASTHKSGGNDEVASAIASPNAIPKADGNGKLAIEWIPLGAGTDISADLEEETHAAEHKHGGNDEIATATPGANQIPKADGSGKLAAGWVAVGNGTDLTADLEEENHAAEHKHGGGDEVATATPGPNEIPKADVTGKLAAGWIPVGSGTDLSADLEEETHAAEHKDGGNDEVATATPGPNEIPKANASGKLAAGWLPLHSGTDISVDLEEENHASEHKHGGGDEVATATPGPNEIPKADATGKLAASWIPVGSGTDLSADLEEETHAAEHKHGGNDEIATATPGANEIPKANASGKLAAGWLPLGSGTDISVDLEEENHASEHKHGGGDEVATATPAPNEIPKADSNGKLNGGWLPQSATLTTPNHIPFVVGPDGALGIDATTGRELFRNSTNGNFGVGTADPTGKLHVKGAADQKQLIVQANSAQTNPLVQWQSSGGANLGVITGTGNIALGDVQTYGAKQYIAASLSPGGLSFGQYIYSPSSLSASSGTSMYSLYAELNHNGGNFNHTGSVYGFGFRAKNLTSGTGTVNNMYGAYVATANQSASSVTNMNALAVQFQSVTAGTITNVHHFLVETPQNAVPSTVTNAYGLYINALNIATNNFGIYQSGVNERNYFGGKVGIGISTPIITGTGRLHASGNTARPFDASRIPASSSEPCNLGEISFGDDYLYVCTATNTWKRAALTSW